MSESALFASLQDTIGSLQSRIRELEDLLQVSMDENISLVQKAARAEALQEQINRLLGDPSLTQQPAMEVGYDSKLAEANCLLQERLDESLRQRDEWMQAAVESKILREMLEQKNQKIVDLTRENAELKARGEFRPADANAPLRELIAKNSSLVMENTQIRQRHEILEKRLAQAQATLRVLQAENTVYDESIRGKDMKIDFRLVKSRIDALAMPAFKGISEKMAFLEERLEKVAQLVERCRRQADEESELRSTISELEEEIHELQENDATPKLMKLKMYIAELEEDNKRLQSLTE
jgi:DNA repair exonuclease SbcCD ATPase subunit